MVHLTKPVQSESSEELNTLKNLVKDNNEQNAIKTNWAFYQIKKPEPINYRNPQPEPTPDISPQRIAQIIERNQKMRAQMIESEQEVSNFSSGPK